MTREKLERITEEEINEGLVQIEKLKVAIIKIEAPRPFEGRLIFEPIAGVVEREAPEGFNAYLVGEGKVTEEIKRPGQNSQGFMQWNESTAFFERAIPIMYAKIRRESP